MSKRKPIVNDYSCSRKYTKKNKPSEISQSINISQTYYTGHTR